MRQLGVGVGWLDVGVAEGADERDQAVLRRVHGRDLFGELEDDLPCHVLEALAEGALCEALLLRLGLAQRDEVDGGGGV